MAHTQSQKPYRSIWNYLASIPFRLDWVDTGGYKSRYLEAGEAGKPVLLMLHGTGGSLEAFCANIPALSKHFHCFALDSLGSGYTGKPDYEYLIKNHVQQVRDFMTAKGLSKVSIMGISMGSWIAARFAVTYPELTERMVLISAFGLMNDESQNAGIVSRRLQAYEDPSWGKIKSIFATLIKAEDDRIDDFIAIRQATYSQPGMKEAARRVLAVYEPQNMGKNLVNEDEWRKIVAPTLVVSSEGDSALFRETARRVGELLPHVSKLSVEEVAHWPQFEKPDEVNTAVIGFLSDSATPAGV